MLGAERSKTAKPSSAKHVIYEHVLSAYIERVCANFSTWLFQDVIACNAPVTVEMGTRRCARTRTKVNGLLWLWISTMVRHRSAPGSRCTLPKVQGMKVGSESHELKNVAHLGGVASSARTLNPHRAV